MNERNRFEQEMRALGVHPGVVKQPKPAMRRAIRDSESYEPSYELSASLAKFKDEAKVPDEAIKKLIGSKSFRDMASVIDKNYVSLDELLASNQPPDQNADGRLSKAKDKQFKNKRVLLIQTGSATEFRRALSVDNRGIADIADIAAPLPQTSAKDLEKQWLIRILCVVAQIRNEAPAKRDNSASLPKRVKARVGEQIVIRNSIDDVLTEIDSKNPGFNIGVLFKEDFRKKRIFVEMGFYPTDLLINGSFILTNLEHCTLLELMEEFRRRKKLKPADIDDMMTKTDEKLGKLSADDVEKEFKGLTITFTENNKQKGDFKASDLESLLFARGLIHRRWQQFLFSPNPVSLDSDTWKTNADMTDVRQAHAKKIFPTSVNYIFGS